eukprot:2841167-Amphidinium_carterae.1
MRQVSNLSLKLSVGDNLIPEERIELQVASILALPCSSRFADFDAICPPSAAHPAKVTLCTG